MSRDLLFFFAGKQEPGKISYSIRSALPSKFQSNTKSTIFALFWSDRWCISCYVLQDTSPRERTANLTCFSAENASECSPACRNTWNTRQLRTVPNYKILSEARPVLLQTERYSVGHSWNPAFFLGTLALAQFGANFHTDFIVIHNRGNASNLFPGPFENLPPECLGTALACILGSLTRSLVCLFDISLFFSGFW